MKQLFLCARELCCVFDLFISCLKSRVIIASSCATAISFASSVSALENKINNFYPFQITKKLKLEKELDIGRLVITEVEEKSSPDSP